MYNEDKLSVPEIAVQLGCSTRTVYNYLGQCGIEIRSMSDAAKLDRGVSISCEQLKILYETQGLTLVEIARLFHCNQTTIHKKLKACGIESRPAGGAMEEYPKKDFDGDACLKAYMLGLRLGDLHVEEGNWALRVRCTSTHPAQIDLIRDLFSSYGGIWISEPVERRGMGITVHLNRSFDFLLPKQDRIEAWMLKDNEAFAAFWAGYIDAEGSFIVSGRRAYFKVDSGDKEILRQAWHKLFELGIEFPEPVLIRPAGTWISHFHLASKKDLWRLATERKSTLMALCKLVAPYLRHEKRIHDMNQVMSNVVARTNK